jgi:hypothetical protein
MASIQHTSSSTLVCTLSGTVLSLIVNVSSQDLIKTGILAAVGAGVSFTVTLVLKWFSKKIKR